MVIGKNIFLETLLNIFPWLITYVPLLSFLAPIIGGGEAGVIAVSFLFANTLYGFLIVFVFSFLGMITIDSIWFSIGRSRYFDKIKNWRRISKGYEKIERGIEKLSKGRDILILLIAKILFGTRIILLLYISGKKRINYKRFLLYIIIPNLIWASILVSIGWIAIKGFTKIFGIFNNIRVGITFLIVLAISIYILQKWAEKKLMKKLEQ